LNSKNNKQLQIVRKLRQVIDPELGVNIVDLGLVYNILIEGNHLTLVYTTTTPGCPMRRYLKQQIHKAISTVEGIDTFDLKLVMDPEWSVDMIVPDIEFFTVPPPQLNQ